MSEGENYYENKVLARVDKEFNDQRALPMECFYCGNPNTQLYKKKDRWYRVCDSCINEKNTPKKKVKEEKLIVNKYQKKNRYDVRQGDQVTVQISKANVINGVLIYCNETGFTVQTSDAAISLDFDEISGMSKVSFKGNSRY